MENFSINDWNEFQENSEGSIKIDGVLSAEELSAIETALAWVKDEIYETTSWDLSRFLHEDILPNIWKFSLEVQEDVLALSEKHPRLDLWIQVPKDLSDTLSQDGLNLSLQNAIWDIESYSQKYLGFPSDSNISRSEYDILITNLWESLQNNIAWISTVVQEKIDDNPDKSLSEIRWIINGGIKEFLTWFKNKVLFPVKQLIDFSSEKHREETIYKEMRREAQKQWEFSWYQWEALEKYVEWHIGSGKMHFNFAYEQLKGHILSWDLDPQTISNKHSLLFGLSSWADPDMRSKELDDFNSNIDVTLLNEGDAEIEKNAMRWFMWAIAWHLAIEWWPALLASVIPWAWTALWAIAWWVLWAWIDIADIFSSEEALLQILKKAWAVPDEYHMEKTLIDNILAWIGLIPWVTLVAKSKKLAELMAKFGVSWSEVLEKMEDVLPILKWDSKEIDFTPQVANINRAPWETVHSWMSRTMRHQSVEDYVQAWWRNGEYWYVDTNWQLHINTQMFEGLSNTEKSRVMREFIAHERAHQAILNFPEWKLREIHASFIKNNVFSVVQDAEKYGLHFRSDQNPLDTTNEILAHMVGRMRVWKDVPSSFIQALEEAWIHDINEVFGVNISRSWWIENAWVQNADNLSDAAMSWQSFNLTDLISSSQTVDLAAEDIFKLLGDNLPDTIDLFELEEKLWITDQKLILFIQEKIPRWLNESALAKDELLSILKSPLDMNWGELAWFLESATWIAKRTLLRHAPIIKNNLRDNQWNIVWWLLDSDRIHSTYETLWEEDFMKVLNTLTWNSISRSDREKIVAWLKARSVWWDQIGSDTVAGVVETTEVLKQQHLLRLKIYPLS